MFYLYNTSMYWYSFNLYIHIISFFFTLITRIRVRIPKSYGKNNFGATRLAIGTSGNTNITYTLPFKNHKQNMVTWCKKTNVRPISLLCHFTFSSRHPDKVGACYEPRLLGRVPAQSNPATRPQPIQFQRL